MFQLAVVLVLVYGVTEEKKTNKLDRQKLKKQLVIHEGKRSKVYRDTVGIPTIGVGFNLNRADAKAKIEALGLDLGKVKSGSVELSDSQIEKLLEADITNAIRDCKSLIPDLGQLSDVRQRVMVDMTFNLGKTRLSKFKKLLAALRKKDFSKAGDEMMDSKWYKQVKTRGKTLVAMMKENRDVMKELADKKATKS